MNKITREALYLLIKIGTVVLIICIFFTTVLGLHRNIQNDMYPAVKDGDLLVYDRLSSSYIKGDIVLVDFEGRIIPGRVVAVSGDEVDITNDRLFVNGFEQQEPDITDRTKRYESDIVLPLTLEENEVFILGDKRDQSTDSRIYGPVKIQDARGKIVLVIRRRNF